MGKILYTNNLTGEITELEQDNVIEEMNDFVIEPTELEILQEQIQQQREVIDALLIANLGV